MGDCISVFILRLLLLFLFSLCGGAVIQIQQLPDQSLSELRSAVALDGVGVGHLVKDVRVIDGDADAQPEYLLPSLVGLMEDKISIRQRERNNNKITCETCGAHAALVDPLSGRLIWEIKCAKVFIVCKAMLECYFPIALCLLRH